MKGSSAGEDWFQAGGGECGFVFPDPRDWHIIYSNNEGFITRYDKNTERSHDISVWPLDNSGHGAEDLKHRFQWVSPLFLSPHNPDAIYTGGEAFSNQPISGQPGARSAQTSRATTRANRNRAAVRSQNDITSVEYYDTIFALAESPLKKGMLWAGNRRRPCACHDR